MSTTDVETSDDVADPDPCFAPVVLHALHRKLWYLIEAAELEDVAIVKGAQDSIGHKENEENDCCDCDETPEPTAFAGWAS